MRILLKGILPKFKKMVFRIIINIVLIILILGILGFLLYPYLPLGQDEATTQQDTQSTGEEGILLENKGFRDPCEDSDEGKNENEAGRVLLFSTSGEASQFIDHCFDVDDVLEFFCEDGRMRQVVLDCPFDCNEGACTDTPIQPVITSGEPCQDSDNGKVLEVFGEVTGYTEKGVPFTLTDHCFDVDDVTEFYCIEGNVLRDVVDCEFGCADGECVSEEESRKGTTADFDTYLKNILGDKDIEIEELSEQERIVYNQQFEQAKRLEKEAEEKQQVALESGDRSAVREFQKRQIIQSIKRQVFQELVSNYEVDEEQLAAIEQYINEEESETVDISLEYGAIEPALNSIGQRSLVVDKARQVLRQLEAQGISVKVIEQEVIRIEQEITKDIRALDGIGGVIKRKFEETSDNVEIKKSVNFINLYDAKTGSPRDVSVVSITVKPEKGMKGFYVYEEIPKEVAANISELIIYGDNYEILDPDPVVIWYYEEVEGEVKASYAVKKKVDVRELGNTRSIPLSTQITNESAVSKERDPVIIPQRSAGSVSEDEQKNKDLVTLGAVAVLVIILIIVIIDIILVRKRAEEERISIPPLNPPPQ